MKKIILFGFVFLLLISSVLAVPVLEDPGIDATTDISENTLWGIGYNITGSENVNLLNWTLDPSNNAPDCVVLNKTGVGAGKGVIVAQVARVGNVCDFSSSPPLLLVGQYYIFAMVDEDSRSSIFTHQKGGSAASLPYSGTYGTVPNCVERGIGPGGTGDPFTTVACGTYATTAYQSNIHYFYVEAAGGTPPAPAPQGGQHTVYPGVIDYLSTTPNNNTQWNYPSKNFSATVNSTLPFNCTLYLNNTINTSFSNTINGTNKLFNINLTFPTIETTISHFWSCIDNSTTVFNSTDTPAISFIDMLPPQTNSSGFVDGTNGFFNNITAQFNFTDGFMLHSYNISIDGIQLAYKSAIGDTYANYNLSIDPMSYSVGLHTITTRWADGHTSEELGGDYEVSSGLFDSYLEYGFYDEGGVTIDTSPSSIFDEFSTTKETDRYKIIYEPFDTGKSEYTFTVESDLYINIYPDAAVYDDYLVMGNHWLDFKLENEPYAEVTITRINDYEVLVNISGIENPSLMEFNSIGDLNIVEKNYTFSATNVTATYSSIVQEFENQYHAMRINKTSGMFGTNAFFYYNNSNYSFTKTSYTGYDLYNTTFITPALTGSGLFETRSFTWVSEVIGINNETYNLTNTQNVYKLGLDNCSTFNVTTMSFSLKDEPTNVLLNGSMSAYLKTWISDINYFATFNLTWGEQPRNNFAICLFPPYASYTTYAQLEFESPGYSKKLYYFANATLTNQTKYIDLLLNNQSSQIKFTVVDTDDNPLKDVYVKVLSYHLPTNSYKVSEILKTDTDGVAYGQLVKSTGDDAHWYQFIIEYNYEVKLTTEPTKITEDTKLFRLSLIDTYFDQITSKNIITNSLTYTEASNNFNFIFSDPTGTANEYCLKVEKHKINSIDLINKTCTTSSAGTILLNAGQNPENSTIIATSYVSMNPIFKLGTLSIGGSELYKTFGQTGIFVTFLLTLTLIGVGIWSPAVATIMAVVGVTMSIIMNLFYLQWGMALTFIILGILTIYRINRT